MGLSENVGYIPNEIAIFHRENDQQKHWVQWGTQHFQTHPNGLTLVISGLTLVFSIYPYSSSRLPSLNMVFCLFFFRKGHPRNLV